MITVYSKNNCVQCKMVKKQLTANNIDFQEINVDEQPEYKEYLKDHGWKAAPVVESEIGDFSGNQPDKVRALIKHYKK